MHCPLTGKPCLMPKEVFVTEVKESGVRHLFMCRKCGDEYIAGLDKAEVITKSLEVVSSDGDVSHNEHILENEYLGDKPQNPPQPIAAPTSTAQQIKAVESKMQDAIGREDYESARTLRDILNELKQRQRYPTQGENVED